MDKIHNVYGLREHRKELRKNQTPEEGKLWWYLRRDQLGVKFRRQHSIGGYIVDFYCSDRKLVIEIDGEIHKKNMEYDEIRNVFLKELGFKILRFSNLDVNDGVNMVLIKIKEEIERSRLPTPV
jgi:very-short-patch-repair endonuclease